MNKKKEQILAALKKLGPSSPSAIADSTGIEPSLCGYHLRSLLAAGAVKATGASNSRAYTLADGKTASAPAAKGGGRKKGRRRKSKKPRAALARPAQSADLQWLPAMDAEGALVVIDEFRGNRIYTPEQTERIATLLFTRYEA